MCADQPPLGRCSDAELITEDGISLMASLWRPEGEGPWPALLMRQPYGRAIASTVTLAHPLWWSTQGYLVVVQDVRGQGASQGRFLGFAQEAADTAATLRWLRSMPDCNGRIGLYGFSYQGFTQLVADGESEPPDCLAPAMTGLDERDHWSCEGGAHWWHLGLGWGLQLAALQAARRSDSQAWGTIRGCLESGLHHREGLAQLEAHDPEGMALRWLHRDPHDRRQWPIHDPPPGWLAQPMLLVGGWWDPHLRGLLDLRNRCLAAGGRPDVHIGPATHLQWWPQAQELHRCFFQRHLLEPASVASGRERPATALQLWDQRRKCWQTSADGAAHGDRWQLAGSALCSHDPDAGQLISIDESKPSRARDEASKDAVAVIVHDPWRPVPAIGGHLSPTPGPCDRSTIDDRGDVATFSSRPLDEPRLLRGIPELSLPAWADQPGFDLCAALSVCPANSSEVQQLSTGVLRLRGEDARHRQVRRLHLQALEAELQPGDRLRLSLAGAAWPAIAINPGHTDQPCGAPDPSCRVISIAIGIDGATLQFTPLHQSPLP